MKTADDKWRLALQFALDTHAERQAEQLSDSHWQVPHSNPADGFAHVTVRDGRVVTCSCVMEHGGRWRPDRPCYHAAAVVLCLHAQWWEDAGVAWEWSAVDDVAVAYPALRDYLPRPEAIARKDSQ